MKLSDIFEKLEAPTRHYKTKQHIVLPGDRPTQAYLIIAGKVRQYQIRDNGSDVVVNTYGPGATVSLSWIVGEEVNDYFFQAIEPTSLRVLPAETLRQALAAEPALAYETLTRLVRGFDGMYQRLIVHGSNKSLQRVMTELSIEAKRFGHETEGKYFVKLTSSELAARTGMTREATSRAIHTLESTGRIAIEKGGYRLKVDT